MPIVSKKEIRPREGKRDFWHHAGRAADFGIKYGPAAAAGITALAKMLNVEKRCFDVSGSSTYTSGVATALLTNIQQGDDGDQCSGNSIKLTDFQFKFAITQNTTGAASVQPYPLRVILLSDREAAGAAPALADILEDVSSPNVINSPLNRSNFGRFQIMYDRIHPSGYHFVESSNMHDLTYGQEKLGEHHIEWDDSNTHSQSTVRKGHIYFFIIYQNIAVTTGTPVYATDATNPPGFTYWARSRFVDN